MNRYLKLTGGLGAALFLMMGAPQAYAGNVACEDAPVNVSTLDCQILRTAILHSVRNKYQRVDIQGAHNAPQANEVYKLFLRWTAARDRVTIGNLLSDADRKAFNPNSRKAQGYAVAWLNARGVNMETYYDAFWAEQTGQVVVTSYPAKTGLSALRD